MPRTEEANQQIREEQRTKILAAAAKVFARKGKAATMADVATETGISQGLAYRYFASKEEILTTLVKQTAELEGRGVRVVMEQEPGSSGVKVIDDYRRRVLLGWAFSADKVTGKKEVRANPLASQAQAGNVKLVRGLWINAFLDESEIFPQGAHDDMVDAASGALAQLTGVGTAEIRWI